MSSEWAAATLGDCLSFASGNTPSKAEPRFWGGLIPWISAKDMKSFWVEDSEDHLTPEGVAVASQLVPAGTTLLLTRGMTLHKDIPIVRTRRAATFNQDVKAISARAGIHPGFAPYLLLGNKARIQALVDSAGHGTGRLGTEQLKAMPVVRPPLAEQRELSKFLAALDDRIALLRETNTTLEAIAQALFKSWFVDFDPVRAKQQGLAPIGVDEATAALFPDRFEGSALGPIPQGWRTGPILDMATLLSGGTPKTDRPEFWGGEIAWASAKDVSQSGSSVLVTTERTITPEGLRRSATRMIPRFATVVVARGATTGRMVMLGCEMAMNQTCYALTSRCDAPIALYCQLRGEIDALVSAAHGSVFDTITTNTFERSNVLQPPPNILACFEEVGRPIFERVVEATDRWRTLAMLRDTLLPRLISGQLRLPEAEALIEETA